MLGGLYIENGVLYDRQSSWPCRSSVEVHFYAFHTFARETYDMWLPARWVGSLRTIVQWKCVSFPHWWYFISAFVWRTILRKWLACSLETGLDLWLRFNIVPETNSEPRKSQCWHVPPTIFHTLICHVLCHEKIGIGICLYLTSRLLNFNQTSFLMFETTWQILCATGRCVPRKNGIFKPLSSTKICTNLAHFDIPALITLHMYNLSICDKRQHVHRGISCPENFVWWD